MTHADICLNNKYVEFVAKVNAKRTRLQQLYGKPVTAKDPQKDFTILAKDSTDTEPAHYESYDVMCRLTVGSKEEVAAGIKNITEESAAALMSGGFAEEMPS